MGAECCTLRANEDKPKTEEQCEDKKAELVRNLSSNLKHVPDLHEEVLHFIQNNATRKTITKLHIEELVEKKGEKKGEGENATTTSFQDLFDTLDADHNGEVSLVEFVATLRHIAHRSKETTTKDGESTEKPVLDLAELALSLFDTDYNGTLEFKEFRDFLRATLNANLYYLVRDDVSRHYLEKYMETERNEENILFWEDCTALENESDDEKFKTKAIEIFKKYVTEDSPKMVNVSGVVRNKITRTIKQAMEGNTALDRKIFKAASAEIFNMMRTDVFARFRKQKGLIDSMAEEYWKQVDVNGDGHIAYEELKKFMDNQPDLQAQMNKIASI
mmetsp:Transcript_13075/g.32034  ORF Transcript_13075/g.32034 Transcript_13075/m.32034 type:complete len:332 (+) Transcript_13075:45-1040(+)